MYSTGRDVMTINPPAMGAGKYIPVSREDGLFYVYDPKFCGTFFFYEPESHVMLKLDSYRVYGSKLHACIELLQECKTRGIHTSHWLGDFTSKFSIGLSGLVDKDILSCWTSVLNPLLGTSMSTLVVPLMILQYRSTIMSNQNLLEEQAIRNTIQHIYSIYFNETKSEFDFKYITDISNDAQELSEYNRHFRKNREPFMGDISKPLDDLIDDDNMDQLICKAANAIGINTVIFQRVSGQYHVNTEVMFTGYKNTSPPLFSRCNCDIEATNDRVIDGDWEP